MPDIAAGFNIGAPVPVDNRMTRKTITERDNIPEGVRYKGMEVYCEDTKVKYRLEGGVTNDCWVDKDAIPEGAVEEKNLSPDMQKLVDALVGFSHAHGNEAVLAKVTEAIITAAEGAEQTENKGKPGGYPELDKNGFVPKKQIPTELMSKVLGIDHLKSVAALIPLKNSNDSITIGFEDRIEASIINTSGEFEAVDSEYAYCAHYTELGAHVGKELLVSGACRQTAPLYVFKDIDGNVLDMGWGSGEETLTVVEKYSVIVPEDAEEIFVNQLCDFGFVPCVVEPIKKVIIGRENLSDDFVDELVEKDKILGNEDVTIPAIEASPNLLNPEDVVVGCNYNIRSDGNGWWKNNGDTKSYIIIPVIAGHKYRLLLPTGTSTSKFSFMWASGTAADISALTPISTSTGTYADPTNTDVCAEAPEGATHLVFSNNFVNHMIYDYTEHGLLEKWVEYREATPERKTKKLLNEVIPDLGVEQLREDLINLEDKVVRNHDDVISNLLFYNRIENCETDMCSVENGVVIAKTTGLAKLTLPALNEDSYLTLLNVVSSNVGYTNVGINGNKVDELSTCEIYNYPIVAGSTVGINISFKTVGAKAFVYYGKKLDLASFNFYGIEDRTIYIAENGSDDNSGTTPINPRKTVDAKQLSFNLKFKGGDIFNMSLNGFTGTLDSYGTGRAIFDSLEEVAVVKGKDGVYTCEVETKPGFIKFNEHEITWKGYGEDWLTNGYYDGTKSNIVLDFGNDTFYVDSNMVLHLKTDRELTKIYIPTKNTAIRATGAATIKNIIVRNYSADGVNSYSTTGAIHIRNVLAYDIGGAFYKPNTRYGNGIQANSPSSNCIIEDCVAHDCFDAGISIQHNETSNNNLVRNCKAWNCFWPFEMWQQNDVTTVNCVAFNSLDLSKEDGKDGYRGVNASTRNALFMTWGADAVDEERTTKYINCYGAYSTGDGLYIGANVQNVVKNCKIYGVEQKSGNTVNSVLDYESNVAKYVEAITIGNILSQNNNY